MEAERYLRQILLAEIGESGQRAIAQMPAKVGGSSGAHEVARLYAERAGFRRIEDSEGGLDPGIDHAAIVTLAAREVLAGVRAVARAMVEASVRGKQP